MAVYYPLFEEVAVYRDRLDPEQYVTIVGRGMTHPVSSLEIDGYAYDYDEHGTEKTRMFMRVAEQRRAEEAGETTD